MVVSNVAHTFSSALFVFTFVLLTLSLLHYHERQFPPKKLFNQILIKLVHIISYQKNKFWAINKKLGFD